MTTTMKSAVGAKIGWAWRDRSSNLPIVDANRLEASIDLACLRERPNVGPESGANTRQQCCAQSGGVHIPRTLDRDAQEICLALHQEVIRTRLAVDPQ